MKIDSFIVTAQKDYMRDRKITAQEFSREMKISPACAVKWSKVGNGITDEKWNLLFPEIKKYLPPERIYIDDSGKERYLSATEHVSDYVFEPKYVPAMVPLIQLKYLSAFDNVIESVAQFSMKIGAGTVEYRPKHPDKSGIMAIKIDDNLHAPVLPRDTTLFIATGGETISVGNLCVAKDIYGEIAIGHYCESKDQFAVTDMVTNKPLVIGEIEQARRFIQWIFPVLYYEVVTF